MIKVKLFGNTYKDQLIASANDRLYKFLIAGGKIRGVIINATKMVNEMRFNHELGILETLVLGHAYIAVGLMSAVLKGNDKIGIQVDCEGPIKGFNVEANAYNEVRGYLKRKPIPVEQPLNSFDLSSFFGPGLLTVTKHLEDSKSPFTGTVALMYGNLAQDLAYYFTVSEQVPTSITLSVQFDNDGNAIGAGGMLLQSMPGANAGIIGEVEKIVGNFPSIGRALSGGKVPADLIKEAFRDYNPEFLGDTRVEFMCHCGKDRMKQYLSVLPADDLKNIISNGPFPVEIRCHNCNTKYYFEKAEIESVNKKIQ